MSSTSYADFLDRRSHVARDPVLASWIPECLFDFQRALVEWALGMGSSALFADCGLGKTPIQLVWAENVVRHTNGRVLIVAPLAVSAQTVREAEKFGVELRRSRDGTPGPPAGIIITNYERLHLFDASDFVGAVCDESGILKSFDGTFRSQITAFMRKLRYRLLCTATPAPNDFAEMGTSSEALGGFGHVDMLARFFVNNLNNCAMGRKHGTAVKWRFRGHAEQPFWRWVCSWARACRRPSDLGFEDGAFVLPPLTQTEHVAACARLPGMLFAMPASGLTEERQERRRTLTERCERVAALVAHERPALVWCHLNDEGDLLERLIPGAIQVSGSDSDEEKESRLIAFANRQARVLVTKPKIGAWGLNFQHCAHVAFFPSHSFEQYYQSIRRCWRFGQKNPVHVDIVTTEGELGVLANLQRKAEAADRMFASIVALMNQGLAIKRDRSLGDKAEEIPSWL